MGFVALNPLGKCPSELPARAQPNSSIGSDRPQCDHKPCRSEVQLSGLKSGFSNQFAAIFALQSEVTVELRRRVKYRHHADIK